MHVEFLASHNIDTQLSNDMMSYQDPKCEIHIIDTQMV